LIADNVAMRYVGVVTPPLSHPPSRELVALLVILFGALLFIHWYSRDHPTVTTTRHLQT